MSYSGDVKPEPVTQETIYNLGGGGGVFGHQKNLPCIYFGLFIFNCNHNSSHLIVLLHHYIST